MGRDRGRGKRGGRGGNKFYIANVDELNLRETRKNESGEEEEESDDEEEISENEKVVDTSISTAKVDMLKPKGSNTSAPQSAAKVVDNSALINSALEDKESEEEEEKEKKPVAELDREQMLLLMKQRMEKKKQAEKQSQEPVVAAPTAPVTVFQSKKPAKESSKEPAAVAVSAPAQSKGKKPVEESESDDDEQHPDTSAGLTRKQREALEAQQRQQDYQKRHNAGQTEAAQRELAQLALVRKRREAAEKKRLSEAAEEAVAPRAAQVICGDDSSDESEDECSLPILNSIDIKKFSGDQLKEHLKNRNLSYQGQKKDLIKRLCDYEEARKK